VVLLLHVYVLVVAVVGWLVARLVVDVWTLVPVGFVYPRCWLFTFGCTLVVAHVVGLFTFLWLLPLVVYSLVVYTRLVGSLVADERLVVYVVWLRLLVTVRLRYVWLLVGTLCSWLVTLRWFTLVAVTVVGCTRCGWCCCWLTVLPGCCYVGYVVAQLYVHPVCLLLRRLYTIWFTIYVVLVPVGRCPVCCTGCSRLRWWLLRWLFAVTLVRCRLCLWLDGWTWFRLRYTFVVLVGYSCYFGVLRWFVVVVYPGYVCTLRLRGCCPVWLRYTYGYGFPVGGLPTFVVTVVAIAVVAVVTVYGCWLVVTVVTRYVGFVTLVG